MSADIFIGPIFYFRLKHMVAEKYARDIGPKVSLTRQPTAGRRKGGGLRIGEMERDSVLSHGVSKFMQESMTVRSDNYNIPVCQNCGTIAVYNPSVKNRILYCKLCNNNTNIVQVNLPYAFKLLIQELEAMNIQLRINTEKLNYVDNNTNMLDLISFEDENSSEQSGGAYKNIFMDIYDNFKNRLTSLFEKKEEVEEVRRREVEEVEEEGKNNR